MIGRPVSLLRFEGEAVSVSYYVIACVKIVYVSIV